MFVMLPGSGGTGVSPAAGSGAAYTFAGNSDFVGMVDFNTNGASNVASTIRTYEATRDLIDTIENKWSGTSVSKYDYENDALGRRTKVANTGTAFSTNRFSLWGYNDRSELTSAKRFDCNTSGSCRTDSNTNSPVSGQQFTYTFDNIGNRTEDTGDPDANTTGYTANNLNQYTATTSPTESFTYDNDGNLTQDALWDYTWDAENRLITVTARNPTSGSKKLTFDYDYMNRRWRKRVYTWNTFGLGFWNTTPSVDRKFVYDGWNLIEELNGLSSDAIISRYTWGLDLSGQNGTPSASGIHGAGGIGGLLAMNDNSGSKNYIYFYNANGDVGQLMDVAGGTSTPAVKYEYYPYGGELLASGLAALVSPFRFSTKYWDGETQNLYYGERYLRPKMGRWVSRDPAQEGDPISNLHVYCRNIPNLAIDPHGLTPIGGPVCRLPTGCSTPINPPLVMPDVVCCQYSFLSIGPRTKRMQTEAYCKRGISPATCCNCALPELSGGLRRASRGDCCWCTVHVMQREIGFLGGPNSPRHVKLVVNCSHGPNSLDYDTYGTSKGVGLSAVGSGTVTRTTNSGYKSIRAINVECRCAEELMAILRMRDNTVYCVGLVDCRTLAWNAFGGFFHDCAMEDLW